MIDLNNIKIFELHNHAVIFNGHDLTLELLPLISTLSAERNKGQATQQEFRNVSQLISHEQDNSINIFPLQPSNKKSRETNNNTLPSLDRLTLNVSNICNMNCQYCYAAGGNYYTSGIVMDRETALHAINYVTRNFEEIRFVNFFGGEPTLNQPVIEIVCEYLIYLYRRGVLKHLPKFGLTTNGYAIDSRMFKKIKTYNFRVSISLDGPKEIHDRMRPSKYGKGTFESVKRNVRTLIDMGIELEYECTYTTEHLRCGIDLVTLMDFFYDNFGCHTLHCPMTVAAPDSPLFMPFEICLELNVDAIRYSIRNLVKKIPKSISTATRLLNSLSSKCPICHYCPAGKSTLTINADGKIYSCFMLMHGSDFCLGKINEEEPRESQPSIIEALLADADKEKNLSCQRCWAQPLCFGCIGDDFERKGLKIFRSEIPGQSDLCDYKRRIIEEFLKEIAESYLLNSSHELH